MKRRCCKKTLVAQARNRLFKVTLLFLVLDYCWHSARAASLPRGLDPALSAAYSTAGDFKCLDGALVITSDRLNDNYCDCLDGSDESGPRVEDCLNRSGIAFVT